MSLRPISYKINAEAVATADFISLQCHGPSVEPFSMERFRSDSKAAVDYRIPRDKLVMGVSPYETMGTTGEQATYFSLVSKGNLANASINT